MAREAGKFCLLLALLALGFPGPMVLAGADPKAPVVKVTFVGAGKTEIIEIQPGIPFDVFHSEVFKAVNPALVGLKFTRRDEVLASDVIITAPAGSTVYLLVVNDHGPVADKTGVSRIPDVLNRLGWWRITGDCVRDPPTQVLAVYKQVFREARQVIVPIAGNRDAVVVSANLAVVEPPPVQSKPAPVSVQSPKQSQLAGAPDSDTPPLPGPTTRVANPQETIKILSVLSDGNKILAGQATDLILTLTPGDLPHALSVHYVTPVGQEMLGVTDDVLRFLHIQYPNWYVERAEFTFGDRGAYDGPSIGAAVGTLIRAAIEGFKIDPNAAITGDIAANGAIHPIGGLSYKLRGAASAGCTVVAVPMKNYDNLVDAVIYSGTSVVSDVQVIGMSDLDDAVATVRSDRDSNLAQAITLFAAIQDALKENPHALRGTKMEGQLQDILKLAPRHFSAKLLLMVVQKKTPRNLSLIASLYYTDVAVSPMMPGLTNHVDLTIRQQGQQQVTPAVAQQELADLGKLRPMADPKILPLIEAWTQYIRIWNDAQSGREPARSVNVQFRKVEDEWVRIRSDPDLNQKLLNEGM